MCLVGFDVSFDEIRLMCRGFCEKTIQIGESNEDCIKVYLSEIDPLKTQVKVDDEGLRCACTRIPSKMDTDHILSLCYLNW